MATDQDTFTKRFIAIPISSLRVDSETRFDLYLRADADGRFVLYARKGLYFDGKAQHRLEQNRVATLYIDSDETEQYQEYLEENLPEVLQDPKIAVSEKADILYETARGLVREIFEHPESVRAIRRSRNVAVETVDLLSSNRHALKHIVTNASYDYRNHTHCVNTCVYAIGLARRVGITDYRDLAELARGAILIDIGKSQIPENILNATSELSLAQWDILRRHTLLGRDLLEPAGEVGPIPLEVVTHHHERLDGKGYPHGLSGNEISVWARIAAIADAFDALTTHRPFQRAVSSFDALRIMGNEMTGAVDRDLFRAFVDLMGNPEKE